MNFSLLILSYSRHCVLTRALKHNIIASQQHIIIFNFEYMPLEQKDTIVKVLKESPSFLVMVSANRAENLMGSALALAGVLEKLGKKVTIATKVSNGFLELPFVDQTKIVSDIEGIGEAIVKIDITKYPVQELRYEKNEGNLEIFLRPSKSGLPKEAFSIQPSGSSYDTVISLGASKLKSLGDIFEKNSKVFFDAQIINIDNSADNTGFGAINQIDMRFTTVAEMVLEIIKGEWENLLDEKLSTYLLLGIIKETDNFQSPKTKPACFLNSASLMQKGAKRDEIIKYLYKNRSLARVRLLGRVMSHTAFIPIKNDSTDRRNTIASTKLFGHDFQKTNTSLADLGSVLNDWEYNLPANVLIIHALVDVSTHKKLGIIKSVNGLDMTDLALMVNGKNCDGKVQYEYDTEKDIAEIEQEVNNKICQIFSS
jgi:nanoRNase/pAp phosphatase (c-di-AMP/oligoRNAs hydrolase)